MFDLIAWMYNHRFLGFLISIIIAVLICSLLDVLRRKNAKQATNPSDTRGVVSLPSAGDHTKPFDGGGGDFGGGGASGSWDCDIGD